MDEKELKVIEITSLDQLPKAGDEVLVEFDAEGARHRIKAKRLSHRQWTELNFSLPQPSPPDRMGPRGLEPNFKNVDYLSELDKRFQALSLLRIAATLVVPIPGGTVEQKANYIAENLSEGFVSAVYIAIATLHGEGDAVAQRVDTFHSDGDAGDAGDEELGDKA